MMRGIFAGVLLILVAASPASGQDGPFGQWVTEGGLSRIEVFDCGGKICGRIVLLEEPLEDDGRPKVDDENQDEALRGRPLMGLQLIAGFAAARHNIWTGGTIYNPQDGKTYASTMELVDENTLRVRGYVLLPLFGKTQTWARYTPQVP